MVRRCSIFLLASLTLALATGRAEDAVPTTRAAGPINFPTATLGGTQFWSDELVYGEWRIQQNVFTGHYRLLDDREFRRAWGTFEQCQAQLEELKRAEQLAAPKGKVLITLHGLTKSRRAMEGIGQYLADEGDYTWLNVGYASTRRTLDEHAQSLARVVEGVPGDASEIHFVCHSLGNLVVRRYLGEAAQKEPQWQPDPRVKRMVMLGPPNNGAQLASLFKNNKLYGLLIGPSGKQLATWSEVQPLLATPSFDFAIIAGSVSGQLPTNPLVAGDDDLIVAVNETRLAGAADFLAVPRHHGELMSDSQTRQCTLRFLQEGHLQSAGERAPIAP